MTEEKSDLVNGALSWWNTISPKDGFDKYNGERAELRRCHCTTDVMFLPSFHLLLEKAGANRDDENELRSLAAVAWVLSWVSSESSESFAKELAVCEPMFQEVRFRRLLESSEYDELALQLIRALKFTKRCANPRYLIEGILAWKRSDRIKEKWALDYYRIASEKKNKGVE